LISEEKNRGSAILSSDHINAFQYSAEKSDSFVIDMDAFSSANHKDPTNANSKITVSLISQKHLNLHFFYFLNFNLGTKQGVFCLLLELIIVHNLKPER